MIKLKNIFNSPKKILGSVIIIGIIILILYSPSMEDNKNLFNENSLNIENNKYSGIFNKIFENGKKIINYEKDKEEIIKNDNFEFEINIEGNPIFEFRGVNISLNIIGNHETIINNIIEINSENEEIEFSFKNFVGLISINDNLTLTGITEEITLSNNPLILKNNGNFDIISQITPKSYIIDGIKINSIQISKINGDIKKGGDSKFISDLNNSTIKINDFIGKISFDSSYKIVGNSSSIENENFNLK